MQNNLKIEYVAIELLKVNDKNPRKWTKEQKDQLKESITKFGNVDPVLVNSHKERKDIVIGGHFRLEVCKELGYTEMPVLYLNLTPEKEQELNIRLNRNHGEFDLELLAEFDETLLSEIGFSSEELDSIFSEDDKDQEFNLQKELDNLEIKVEAKKGDVYELDGSRLMVGDSTVESDMLTLCGEEKIDMVMTDPPYRLDYLHFAPNFPNVLPVFIADN